MSSAKLEAVGRAGVFRIGVSGSRYPRWRGGAFYPKGLPQYRELEYTSRGLPSIELNGSFYSLQRPENYAAWYDDTPPGFVFSVKGSRYCVLTTSRRRLRTSSPRAWRTCATSSVLSCGNCRPIFATTRASSIDFWPCFRATPIKPRRWRGAATPRSRVVPASRSGQRDHCATRWKSATTLSSTRLSLPCCASTASPW
jgi:Protein of unknown function DUF72